MSSRIKPSLSETLRYPAESRRLLLQGFATGMTDDARASITESQDGQWHMTDWDGYQAIWQRSGTSTDVVVRIR